MRSARVYVHLGNQFFKRLSQQSRKFVSAWRVFVTFQVLSQRSIECTEESWTNLWHLSHDGTERRQEDEQAVELIARRLSLGKTSQSVTHKKPSFSWVGAPAGSAAGASDYSRARVLRGMPASASRTEFRMCAIRRSLLGWVCRKPTCFGLNRPRRFGGFTRYIRTMTSRMAVGG